MAYEMPHRCANQNAHAAHPHAAEFGDGIVEDGLWCAGYRERDQGAPEYTPEPDGAPTTVVGGYVRPLLSAP